MTTPANVTDATVLDGYRETELGLLPEEWEVVPLGDTATLRGETVLPQKLTGGAYVGLEHMDTGYPRIRRYGNPSEVRSAKSVFHPGDVLYGKLRPYLDKAALAEVSGVCSADILVLVAVRFVDPAYLSYLMHTAVVLQHAIATTSGVNHPRTSWKALGQAPIPLPPGLTHSNLREPSRGSLCPRPPLGACP